MTLSTLLLAAVFVNSDAWNFWLDKNLATMDRDQIVAAVKRDVDFYARPGVEAVFYNMNFQRSFYATKVGTPYWKDCAIGADGKLTLRGKPISSIPGEESPEETYRTMFLTSKNVHEKCPDLMRLRYRYCREKGLEMWHSMRMDDVHHTPLKSEFRPQHCDLWLDRAAELTRAWYRHFERIDWHDNALDYGIPEVYDYHLNMMREYLLDWEADGIELDWLRALPVFKPGHDEANAPLLTAFLRETRRTADAAEKKWGHRVRIAVRVPGRIREAFLCGLDVATWAKEGLVDVIIPSCSNTSTEQDYDIALYKAIANGRLVTPEINCTMVAAWGYSMSCTAETDAGFVSNFYQQGADGIYFYNHFPLHKADKPFVNESFVLAGDRAAAARAARRHVVTRHDPAGEGVFSELTFPQWIWTGTGNGGVRVNCGEGVKGRSAEVVIGLSVTNTLALRVNTVKCPLTEKPLPAQLPKGRKGAPPIWHHFEIPAGVLHDGFNNLEIFNAAGPTIESHQVVWAEVVVSAARRVEVGTGLDPYVRPTTSLNGLWDYIVDPQDMGASGGAGFHRDIAPDGVKLVQHDYDRAPKMQIPGDWNTQDEKLFFYEGRVWFRRKFSCRAEKGRRTLLRFGAVNYRADVWLDGQKLGEHVGGFTPFAFDVTGLMTNETHALVVCVDNTRAADAVPCAAFDWWNYGGITRDVTLFDLPETYVAEGVLRCARGQAEELEGYVRIVPARPGVEAVVEIPELKVRATAKTEASGLARFRLRAKPELWSPARPKRYRVSFSAAGDAFADDIGFRTVETRGKQILLNGEPVFLKGVCAHDEVPGGGRVHSADQVLPTISWARELGCNYMRLAHYPHNEGTVRTLEQQGLMAWSEIPVYWQIAWTNAATYANAENQLKEMLRRDANRAAIVIWSLANETPWGDARDRFLFNLSKTARTMDDTRLISMAMLHGDLRDGVIRVEDTVAPWVDVVSFNEYLCWYWSDPETAAKVRFDIPFEKPVIVSEFGGGAIAGRPGPKTERWSEAYLAEVYRANLEMLAKIDGLSGLSPWVLFDFRSPRRPCPGLQDYFNRKGLVSEKGEKKQAFEVLREFYRKR